MSNNPCDPAQPFVKLGNGSNAPTLDYNLPQESCYDIYLPFKVSIPPEFFKDGIDRDAWNNIFSGIGAIIN